MSRTMVAASTSASTRSGATCAGAGMGTGCMRTGTTAKRVRRIPLGWDCLGYIVSLGMHAGWGACHTLQHLQP